MKLKDICDICGKDHKSLDDSQICSKCKNAFQKKRYQPSQAVKDHRALAKMFGGKALKGSAKQKEWAEKIRAEFISSDSLAIADKKEVCQAVICDHASFWINNKSLKASDFAVDNILSCLNEQREINSKICEKRQVSELNKLRERKAIAQKKMWISEEYV